MYLTFLKYLSKLYFTSKGYHSLTCIDSVYTTTRLAAFSTTDEPGLNWHCFDNFLLRIVCAHDKAVYRKVEIVSPPTSEYRRQRRGRQDF